MHQKAAFHFMAFGGAAAVGHKQVADDSFAALVDEEGVAEDAPTLYSGVARQNLGVDVAEDHVGGTGVIPGEQTRPDLGFVVQQGAEINGREVPEIENLHGAPTALRPDSAA